VFARMKVPSLALVVVALLVSSAAVVGCGSKKDSSSPELGFDSGAGTGSGVVATGSAGATDSTSPKTPGQTNGEDAAGSGAEPGQSGSNGSGSSGGTTGSKGSGDSGSASTAPKTIRVNWWNDTSANSPKNPAISFNGKTIKPKAGKSDVMTIGPCPVGKELKLTIYPDGTSGRKLVATFRVDASMVANSDQDAIHIEVRDERVRVLGNPIPNFEESFER